MVALRSKRIDMHMPVESPIEFSIEPDA